MNDEKNAGTMKILRITFAPEHIDDLVHIFSFDVPEGAVFARLDLEIFNDFLILFVYHESIERQAKNVGSQQ